jgi:hypothetical protein
MKRGSIVIEMYVKAMPGVNEAAFKNLSTKKKIFVRNTRNRHLKLRVSAYQGQIEVKAATLAGYRYY